jgi:long-subunit fatty acid transport protein
MKVRSCLMAVFVLVVLGFGAPAWAQTDEEHFQTFPFNFSNPGARPSAMGGAFIGLANDASAAVTNPAGLTFLTRAQFYAEYKNMYAPVVRLGAFDSMLTGFGDFTSTERVMIPGFINVAVPLKGGRVTVAFSMYQFLKYSTVFTLNERRSFSSSLAIYPWVSTVLDYSASSYLGSVGFKVTEDGKLRVGVSGSLNRMSAYQTSVRRDTTVTKVMGKNLTTSMNDTDYAFGVNAGMLYDVHKMLTVGFNYTRAPSFTMTEYVGDTNLTFNGGTAVPVKFNIPDRWGIGLAFKPHPRYTVLFDAVRVNYSKLASETTTIYYANYNFANAGAKDAAGKATQFAPTPGSFYMDDAIEYHGGMEAKIIQGQRNSVFARFGIFTMAPHMLKYTPPEAYNGFASGYSPTNPLVSSLPDCSKGVVTGCYPVSIVAQPLYAASQFYIGTGVADSSSSTGMRLVDGLSLSKTDIGVTFGGGIAVGSSFQLDFAYLVTNNLRRNEVVISTAIRF